MRRADEGGAETHSPAGTHWALRSAASANPLSTYMPAPRDLLLLIEPMGP